VPGRQVDICDYRTMLGKLHQIGSHAATNLKNLLVRMFGKEVSEIDLL